MLSQNVALPSRLHMSESSTSRPILQYHLIENLTGIPLVMKFLACQPKERMCVMLWSWRVVFRIWWFNKTLAFLGLVMVYHHPHHMLANMVLCLLCAVQLMYPWYQAKYSLNIGLVKWVSQCSKYHEDRWYLMQAQWSAPYSLHWWLPICRPSTLKDNRFYCNIRLIYTEVLSSAPNVSWTVQMC